MNVNYIAGNSLDDIYAVIARHDWELGGWEGVSQWNGSKWHWLARYGKRNDYIAALLMRGGHPLIVTTSGNFHHIDPSGQIRENAVPPLEEFIGSFDSTERGFTLTAAEVLVDGSIIAVGS